MNGAQTSDSSLTFALRASSLMLLLMSFMFALHRLRFHLTVDFRFVLGRERDSSQSEVARLIQMSIEQDQRRAELRRSELEQRERQQRLFEYHLQHQLNGNVSDSGDASTSLPEQTTRLAAVIDKVGHNSWFILDGRQFVSEIFGPCQNVTRSPP